MKAGFIAVVGRPNVGKSTLINKLVSEKVAIVSDKAGTTRDNIKGILNFKDNQYIFIDTPGIHKPQHLLGEYMTNIAVKILKDVDIILFLIDASKPIGTGDMFVMDRINENSKKPRILLVNKVDLISDEQKEEKLKEIDDLMAKLEIEAKKGDNTALIELGEWEDVKLFYIAPPKKYKKPDLLNGMKWWYGFYWNIR